MILYMNQIFNNYDIKSIIKLLLYELAKNSEKDKSLSKLIFQIFELMRRKCNNEEIIKILFSLIKENPNENLNENQNENQNENNEIKNNEIIENNNNYNNNNIYDYETCYDRIIILLNITDFVFPQMAIFEEWDKYT